MVLGADKAVGVTPLTRLFGSVAPLPRCPQRHWELTRALGGLLLGLVDHPLAEVDEGILLSCGHGVGQLAQLDGEPVQILAQGRNSHETTPRLLGLKWNAAIKGGRGRLHETVLNPLSSDGPPVWKYSPGRISKLSHTCGDPATGRSARLRSR
jgi:hypothetical protein